MKKTYADQCLECAEKMTEGPWVVSRFYPKSENPNSVYHVCSVAEGYSEMSDASEFIAHARVDVPELSRRLKIACEALRVQSGYFAGRGDYRYDEAHELYKLADELERI